MTLGREALFDSPSQGRPQPLDGAVDGRVHVVAWLVF